MLSFSVPTNWSDELLESLVDFPVEELYGALPETVTGGGRAARALPNVTAKEAARHIQRVHHQKIAFNYLLNGTCFGNRETDLKFRRALHEHLQWLADMGIKRVTVSNPYLLDFIKTHFPDLSVRISVFAMVGNVATALRYQKLKADAITLMSANNRNFSLLKKMRAATDGDLWLLANVACAFDCEAVSYHANTCTHDSQSWQQNGGGMNPYPLLKCTIKKLTEAHQLVRARWIRPEDLAIYEQMGFSKFKIAGRDAGTDWIHKVLKAYTERRYDGNLAEILDGFHYLNAWRKMAGNIPFALPFIDNRALNGFLRHFQAGSCEENCHACHHCEEMARKAVTLNRADNRQLINVIEALKETKLMI